MLFIIVKGEIKMKKLIITGQNTKADGSLFEDQGLIQAEVLGGDHDGHKVNLKTAKYNCGAYLQEADCSCGKFWQNEMSGCWQLDHQRTEKGDDELARMFTLKEFEIVI